MEFFFDPVSPNAYLAWHVLPNLAKKFQRDLVAKPVLFAGLLQAYDQAGPAEVAPKIEWMFRNCLQKSNSLGIEFNPPHSHPFNPLLFLRLILAARPDDRHRVIDRLMAATWVEGKDVSDRETMTDLLNDLDLDASAMLTLASGETIKKRLRMDTELAISRGIFGVPTVVVDDELFFGFDDFPWLERFLAGDSEAERKLPHEWKTINATAQRRRR